MISSTLPLRHALLPAAFARKKIFVVTQIWLNVIVSKVKHKLATLLHAIILRHQTKH